MTVIIALKHNGINYIAADCRTSAWYDLVNDTTDKILNHNWCLIGLAWDVSIEWIIKRILNDNKKLIINNENCITDIYLKIRQIAKEHNLLEVWEYPGVEWLFVTDKHIRELYSDWAVIEHEHSGVIWCGAPLATGIMEWMNIINPETELQDIIKKVSKYSVWVSSNSIVKIATPIAVIKKLLKKKPIKKTKPKQKKKK